MLKFVKFVRNVCFVGSRECNQGGGRRPETEIIGGVVNNSIQITHNGVIVVHTGS